MSSHLDTINLFETMDKQLGDLLSTFADLASQIELREVCYLNDEAAIGKLVYPGIYLIELKTTRQYPTVQEWATWFKSQWDHETYSKKYVPTTKKKRIDAHVKLEPWMPVYLGKSKGIAYRVLEHINLGLEKPTYAMKLKARGDFFTDNSFRLKTAHIDITHYDLIMPMVEHVLRRKINPIVGKQ